MASTLELDRHPAAERAAGGLGPVTQQAAEVNLGETERWAFLVGGGLMTAAGLRRGDAIGYAAALAGGLFIYHGVSGYSPIYSSLGISTAGPEAERGVKGLIGAGEVHLEDAVIVDHPAEELYSFWRNFENHPRFMSHLETVTTQEDSRSHWVLKAPLGARVEWSSEVTDEQPGEYLAWRTLEGSDIEHSGSVRFRPATGGRGTEVRMKIDITPPLGPAGAAVAKLLAGVTEMQLRADLKKFKQLMEAGEIATTEGQPSGRK